MVPHDEINLHGSPWNPSLLDGLGINHTKRTFAMMIVKRLYVSPIDVLPKLSGPTVVRPVLNDPNRVTTVGGYKVCVPQVPTKWATTPIPYTHDDRVAFEYRYRDIRERLIEFVETVVRRYANDPNCVGIEMGVFGQWGEWTTWRHARDRYPKATEGYKLFDDDDVLAVFGPFVGRCRLFARSLGGVRWDSTSVGIGHRLTVDTYDDVFGTTHSEALWDDDEKYRTPESKHIIEIASFVQRDMLANPKPYIALLGKRKPDYVVRPHVVPQTDRQRANLDKVISAIDAMK